MNTEKALEKLIELSIDAARLLQKAQQTWTCAGIANNKELAEILARAKSLGLLRDLKKRSGGD